MEVVGTNQEVERRTAGVGEKMRKPATEMETPLLFRSLKRRDMTSSPLKAALKAPAQQQVR